MYDVRWVGVALGSLRAEVVPHGRIVCWRAHALEFRVLVLHPARLISEVSSVRREAVQPFNSSRRVIMHERWCLNAATVKTSPLDVQIQLACQAGFRQIGLWSTDVEASISAGKTLGQIKSTLDSCGLRVAELCFLGGWQDAAETEFQQVLRTTAKLCGLCRALDCEILVTVPTLKAGHLPEAPGRLRQICRIANDYGVRVALEFPGNAAEVKDLCTAHGLISAAGCPNAGLVIDAFHFFLGGSKLADFDALKGSEIFLVHVSDAMNLPMEKLRVPHDNRTFPGEGIIDFVPFFEQLGRLGYQGAVSLEIWNSEVHRADPAEIVRKSCAALQRMEGMLNHQPAVRAEAGRVEAGGLEE